MFTTYCENQLWPKTSWIKLVSWNVVLTISVSLTIHTFSRFWAGISVLGNHFSSTLCYLDFEIRFDFLTILKILVQTKLTV